MSGVEGSIHCHVCGVNVVPKALPADGNDYLLACPDCGLLLDGVASGRRPQDHEGRTYHVAPGVEFLPPPGVLPEPPGEPAFDFNAVFRDIVDGPPAD